MPIPSTRWSLIQQLDGTRAESLLALEQLCQTYWPAVYALVRRRGFSPSDSEDFTQSFFEFVIERNTFSKVNVHRGRFRNFLKTAVNNYLSNEWNRMTAKKRGGGVVYVRLEQLDWVDAASSCSKPEAEFDRIWALTLLSEAIKRVETEYERRGRGAVFVALKPTLTGEGMEQTYREIGKDLSMSETAVKLTVRRMRTQFQKFLREEIAETVTTPEQAEEELADLKAIFFEKA